MTHTHEQIAAVLEQAYATLEFAPGDQPNWERFMAVFDPRAVLALRVFPGDPAISVMGLADYAREQMREGLSDEGYSETPGELVLEVIGDVAVAKQEFSMNFANGSVEAVDVFSLVRSSGDWRVVAVVSDVVGGAAGTSDPY